MNDSKSSFFLQMQRATRWKLVCVCVCAHYSPAKGYMVILTFNQWGSKRGQQEIRWWPALTWGLIRYRIEINIIFLHCLTCGWWSVYGMCQIYILVLCYHYQLCNCYVFSVQRGVKIKGQVHSCQKDSAAHRSYHRQHWFSGLQVKRTLELKLNEVTLGFVF